MEKKIVIIGAGYTGVLTAKKLAKRLKNDDVTITLIDKNSYHTMLSELHEVAACRVDEESIRLSLKKIFAKRKVNIVLDKITSIDFEGKKAIGEKDNYSYDYLVIAAGSQPTYFNVEGAKEFTFKLWSYEDALILKNHIHEVFRKASNETDISKIKELLTFHIIGAGFTGVEMSAELAEYIPILCEKYEIDRELVTIYIVDILDRTVPALTKRLSEKVSKRLGKMGVKIYLNTNVLKIGSDFIETEFNGNKVSYKTGTVIWAAGIESANITKKAAETLEAAQRGRIKIDKYLRSLSDKSVYVGGDNMFYIPEGEDAPVPQIVENCENSADIISKNIIYEITGRGKMHEYKPSFHGIMVSLGGRHGVARVGTKNRMYELPSFLAMFVKHFINIVYFFQVLGWNKVFSYLKHEFFTIRYQRSFVGGHFSNRTPSFLLVPLRIWLGAIWLFEGIMKVLEGWLKTPKLDNFFGQASSWYNSIISPAADAVSNATAVAADATSTATQAAGGAAASIGTAILNFDILGLFKVIFVSGKELISSTLADYAFKLDVPLVNWFIDNLILPYDWVQILMQALIVIAEILIGLALIGGLFTTPAAAVSLILQFMFVTTTGLYLVTFWMIFAGIAVLFGGGKVFGLDYYVIPFLKKRWKKIPLVRKSYLYHD